MNIGVLAVQGAFAEHIRMLEKLNVDSCEIRKKDDLIKPFDGLILPGGESTVIGKLLMDFDMLNPIREHIKKGMPVFGTCAGMILLAEKIENCRTSHLGTMNITVVRNAYGRQLGSFNTVSEFHNTRIKMPFIRAPYIENAGSNVKVLAVIDGKIVAAQQDNQLAIAFHPELTNETVVHEYFLNMIKKKNNSNSK